MIHKTSSPQIQFWPYLSILAGCEIVKFGITLYITWWEWCQCSVSYSNADSELNVFQSPSKSNQQDSSSTPARFLRRIMRRSSTKVRRRHCTLHLSFQFLIHAFGSLLLVVFSMQYLKLLTVLTSISLRNTIGACCQ